jgi:hypothetical protein
MAKLSKGVAVCDAPSLEKAMEILKNCGYDNVTAVEKDPDVILKGMKSEPSTTVQDLVYSEAGFIFTAADDFIYMTVVGSN